MNITFDLTKLKATETAEGIKRWIVLGKEMGIALFEFKKGTKIHPAHKHSHEQAMYVIKGKIEATVGKGENEEKTILTSGMVQIYPPDVLHGIKVLEDVQLIEVVAPVPAATSMEGHPYIASE